MTEDFRLQQLRNWLQQTLQTDQYDLSVASADASFRRYFRIRLNNKSMIAMDAPPDKENCQPFIDIASLLFSAGINAPEILQQDLSQGFLLLSDLGDTQYLSVLDSSNCDQLYKDAIDALIQIQTVSSDTLPSYDRALLQNEMNLFSEWFIEKHLSITLDSHQQHSLNSIMECLIESALQQPQVFVHRDYHSRNLMQTAIHNPGVIDFQDAVTGAVTYDLASLFKDCYISWPRTQIEDWLSYYFNKAKEKNILDPVCQFEDFIQWFDLMSVQRHLKVLGIFSRLNSRDNKPGYLKDLPLTFQYIADCCERYPVLTPLKALLQDLDIAEKLGCDWKMLA